MRRATNLRAAALFVAMLGVAALVLRVWNGRVRPSSPVHPYAEEMELASERLRAFDAQQRTRADFAHLPTWDELCGPEPYVIARVPGSPRSVGLLRGSNALVVLDEAMHEVQRVAAPAAPVALSIADDGAIFVAGELASTLARFDWRGDRIEPAGTWELGDVRAIRALAAGASGWVYVAEERGARIYALRLEHGMAAARDRAAQLHQARVHTAAARRGSAPALPQDDGIDRILERRELGTCRGPIRAMRVSHRLIVDCLLDHALIVHRLDESGAPSPERPIVIRHDGPIWGFDALPTEDGLLVAAGGVEDHPLDRTIGAFGYIDSFLFVYRVSRSSDTAVREAAVNLSELGVVTPKAIALRERPLAVTVTGYGSDKLIELSFVGGVARPPVARTQDFVPGTSAVTWIGESRLAFADPLLDAWVVASPGGPPTVEPIVARPDAPFSEPELRLGEALFFTTLMAPFNSAEGALSRFTCETCHHEGYVDGRTHHTGRDDVHAVTKPLLGLFNNRPHFSRALDPDLTAVVFNEFRVAGAKSGHDPWFSAKSSDAPWTRLLGLGDGELTPEAMRKALMYFLIAFQHRPNPAVLGRATFSEHEREGAAMFRDRCESCHEARLASDQPGTRVPFESWEGLVMAREGNIVWGKDVYAKTGVLPYVHEKGARVPSLRRLYKKHPYFTNGSADSLDEVLARARFLRNGFRHDMSHADGGSTDRDRPEESDFAENLGAETLDARSRDALLAFLRLL